MARAVFCVVCCLSSLRGTSKCLCLLAGSIARRTPCWTSVQNWVLRFGLYVLQRPVPRREDWVLVLDQAVNLGTRKLLVVLAVSLETLRERQFKLRHQDMRVVAVSTATHCDGPAVAAVLSEVANRIGGVAQIVCDGGGNLKCGIRKFREHHPATVASGDITHATALMLKDLLELDQRLIAFTARITELRRQVAQTECACLAPPSPRDKSRWLNLEPYLDWARRMQKLRAAPKPRGRPSLEAQRQLAERERLFAWLDGFDADMATWDACLSVVTAANTLIKREGLSKTAPERFRTHITAGGPPRGKAGKLARKITDFLQKQAAMLPDDRAWLGTSDIIESVFGKYKLFSARTPLPEMGKAVLVIPALTAEADPLEIAKAMATVSTADVQKWLAQNVGYSLLAKRNRLLGKKKTIKTVNILSTKSRKAA